MLLLVKSVNTMELFMISGNILLSAMLFNMIFLLGVFHIILRNHFRAEY